MNRRTFFGGVTAGVLTGVGAVKASVFSPTDDEPTYVGRDGSQFWYNEYGEYHRIGGPAIIRPNGTQRWYENGIPHRIGGPASIYANGAQDWYEHGEFHRIGGPAIICSNGDQWWYQHGKCHRIGGPAINNSDGTQKWFEHGHFLYREYHE